VSQILNIKKNYFYYFLFIYFFWGVISSLNVGITHDEPHNLLVWDLNKSIILNTIFNKNYDISLMESGSKYYGSGFHLLSLPIELIIELFFNNPNITSEAKSLIIKHPSVFIFFIISGVYFRKIIFFITKDKNYSSLCTILYLTYPYLLGHSFFNIKDIPFLSVWLLCTYYIMNIVKDFYEEKKIKNKHLIILSILTAYLLSIRITGILIFIEYITFFIFAINLSSLNYFNFLKLFYKKITSFLLTTLFLFYILNPAYWNNPLEIIDGIRAMSHYMQTVCTITLGECMKAQNLPSSYLPIWFFFKLPALILFGIVLLAVKEKFFFSSSNNTLMIAPIIIATLLIIFLLILFNVNLYDEIRQVMFLIPLIFIISMSAMFILPRKILFFSISIFIIFFIYQNIKIYPYNYVWLNNLTVFTKISNNFELDYWGVSSKKIALFLNKKNLKSGECIISNRNNGIRGYIKNKDLCLLPFEDLHKKNVRPFYVALMERFTDKGLPNNCQNIYNEKININFSKENLIMAKVFKCD
tara:strand:- start:1430 stop:3010 length:1581 start_codon:yes stop_codon:yes gene_type:complete